MSERLDQSPTEAEIAEVLELLNCSDAFEQFHLTVRRLAFQRDQQQIEIKRLTRCAEAAEKAKHLLLKGMESQCELMDGLKQETRQQKMEIERLKRGEWTAE